MKHRITFFNCTIFILLAALFSPAPAGAAGAVKKIAILPFTMHSDRDLTFLQAGIMDMLISRLASEGQVEPLGKTAVKKAVARYKGPVDKAQALEIGKSLGADYVIMGSLTVFGDSVSIDARILDVASGEELATAYNQSKGMDEVIPTVNRFAKDINEKIMGRPVRAPAPGPAAPAGAGAAARPAAPPGLIRAGETYVPGSFGYVRRFPTEIVGIAVGDVLGDGKNQLVFADKRYVYVYRWRNNALEKAAVYDAGFSAEIVYVSLLDSDGNGKAEIYVTNLGDTDVRSFVLEWQGNGFKRIAKEQPWFFRVINIPGKGRRLIGQRRRGGGFYLGPVYELKRKGNNYEPATELALPRRANVYNFAYAGFAKGEGITNTVMLNPNEYLEVYDASRQLVWRSEDYYGGTVTYMTTDNSAQTWRYFPSPIYITEVDGQPEVMVCKNRDKLGRVFARFRWFSSGTVDFLTWDGASLSMKWETKKFGGPVVGYRVADVDNDGLPELVVCTVLKEAHILGSPRSQIVIYNLK